MPRSRLTNPVRDHKAAATAVARVAIVTLSSTRSLANDQSGNILQELLEGAGHSVAVRKLIPDSATVLRATLRGLIRQDDVDAVLTTGGTGLAASDVTVETVRAMLEKEMPGFTALFMLLSYPQVKSAAMLSRAVAGTIGGKPVFCLPGSPRACKLAAESLIIPELGHLLKVAGS